MNETVLKTGFQEIIKSKEVEDNRRIIKKGYGPCRPEESKTFLPGLVSKDSWEHYYKKLFIALSSNLFYPSNSQIAMNINPPNNARGLVCQPLAFFYSLKGEKGHTGQQQGGIRK